MFISELFPNDLSMDEDNNLVTLNDLSSIPAKFKPLLMRLAKLHHINLDYDISNHKWTAQNSDNLNPFINDALHMTAPKGTTLASRMSETVTDVVPQSPLLSKESPEYHHRQATRLCAELGVNGYEANLERKLEDHMRKYNQLTGKHVDFTKTCKKWGIRNPYQRTNEVYASPPPMKDMIAISGADIKVGDKIRTKKIQMIGKVEKITSDKFNENDDKMFFRISDGRLMKTTRRNCVKINPEIKESSGTSSDIVDESENDVNNDIDALAEKWVQHLVNQGTLADRSIVSNVASVLAATGITHTAAIQLAAKKLKELGRDISETLLKELTDGYSD